MEQDKGTLVAVIERSKEITKMGWCKGVGRNPYSHEGCLVTNLFTAAMQLNRSVEHVQMWLGPHKPPSLSEQVSARRAVKFMETLIPEQFQDEDNPPQLKPLAYYNDYGNITQEDAIMLHDKALAELGAL